ncbi:MAG: hypothetical protein H6Q73_4522 [Firmicutes bacterium]|nr:hypothetical protein [Bacillota bacterium]
MKKIIFRIFLLLVLYFVGPNIIDAINLRFFASPEDTLNRFYTEHDLAEDQLKDSLILAGTKMVPLLEREILKKDIPRRRYAIGTLGYLGNENSLVVLEHIFHDESEEAYFRGDALLAIASIDLLYAQKIASQHLNDMNIAKYAREVLTTTTRLDQRSYCDALFHRHW